MKQGERGREPTPAERARAAFYAEHVMIPILLANEGERTELVKRLSEQEFLIPHSRRCRVSQATIWRLLKKYQTEGLDGLMRKPRNDAGRSRVIPPFILKRAIAIRMDLRSRSTRRILKILKQEYPLETGVVRASTLSHALTRAGCPRIRRRREGSTGPQKERHIHMRWERPLQLVQSDACGKTLWVKHEGRIQKATLLAVLDHCSKRVLHGEWFIAANLPALEKCVTQSLLAYGLFERLHVDHGAIYESYLLKNVCLDLIIDLKFTRKGYAPGKGGIERFWLTVEEDFIPEIGDSTRFTLAELNQKYWGWQHEYDTTVHSVTGETPLERFERLMSEPRYPDPVKLRRATLLREHRIVDKRFCVVHVRSVEFGVDPSLRGQRVEVRYDPWCLNEVLVYDALGSRLLERALPVAANAPPAPFLPAPPLHPTPTIDALTQLEEERARHLRIADRTNRRPAAEAKRPTFAAFCRQVGGLLLRESDLDSFELESLRDCWERFGPFAPDFVSHTLEPLVSHVGHRLHLVEYLNTLSAAHLSQEKE